MSEPLWLKSAFAQLEQSLCPQPHEQNQIDWKSALSENNERLNEHLSAFSNTRGGGTLVFGLDANGELQGIADDADAIITRLGNLARQGVEPAICLDHAIADFMEVSLLFVRVPESEQKPVHIRGKSMEYSFIRSAGQTRRMGKEELKQAISESRGDSYEQAVAMSGVPAKEIEKILHFPTFFALTETPMPGDLSGRLQCFVKEGFLLEREGLFEITNMGALLFALELAKFSRLARKAPRVVQYAGKNRLKTTTEREAKLGFAVSLPKMMKFIMSCLPHEEVIEEGIRHERSMYPQDSIRELVVNAIVHQDLWETGTGPIVEIYSDRIEITNPGRSLLHPHRMLDEPPKSRNELLARTSRRLGLCEERGQGLDRVMATCEAYCLPAPEINVSETHTQVVVYGRRELARMKKAERVNSCFFHAVVQYYIHREPMTNKTVRKRFGLPDHDASKASRIIQEAASERLLKPHDPESGSRKYSRYVPYWVS